MSLSHTLKVSSAGGYCPQCKQGTRKYTTGFGATRPGPQDFQNTQEDEIQKLHGQNLEKRQKRLEQLYASDPRYVKELDLKECMLEVQAALLGRVAAEENHIKGLVETCEPSDINFDERVKK